MPYSYGPLALRCGAALIPCGRYSLRCGVVPAQALRALRAVPRRSSLSCARDDRVHCAKSPALPWLPSLFKKFAKIGISRYLAASKSYEKLRAALALHSNYPGNRVEAESFWVAVQSVVRWAGNVGLAQLSLPKSPFPAGRIAPLLPGSPRLSCLAWLPRPLGPALRAPSENAAGRCELKS